jgi:hypothetical protein
MNGAAKVATRTSHKTQKAHSPQSGVLLASPQRLAPHAMQVCSKDRADVCLRQCHVEGSMVQASNVLEELKSPSGKCGEANGGCPTRHAIHVVR